jgi:N-acetylneuraminic acid mutarotase
VVPATPPPPPSSMLLCDTFNFAAVTQQAGGPPNPTTCSLSAPTMITQVATYQYNGGNGAAPGTISLQLPGGQTFGPFTATGVAGQSGPNEAWVATPNVIVPAGTHIVIDSNPATWSYNTGSNNSGFVREWGSAVNVSTLSFVTQPTDTNVNQIISPAVQVKATDSTGAAVPFIAITVSIGGSGGTLLGTTTQTTDGTGVATFADLSVNFAETYTMFANAAGSTAQASSSSFMVIGWVSETAFADPRPNGGAGGTVGIQDGAASLINGKIYVSHGFRSIDSNLLSVYSIVNNSWSHDPAALPTAATARSYLGSGVANGKHYAIGGEAFGRPLQIFATVEQYDPVANAWTTMASMPTPRAGLGVASWNNLIYAVGGRNGGTDGQGTIFNALEVFDPVKNAWGVLSPMPTAVSDISATVAYNNKIYVFGGATGFNATNNTVTVVNLVQIYDIANASWSAGTPMPTARAAALAGVFGNRIIVFGGVDTNMVNLGVSEIYDPAMDKWTAGPAMLTPAGEMCQGVIFDGTNVFAIGQFGAGEGATSAPVQDLQF